MFTVHFTGVVEEAAEKMETEDPTSLVTSEKKYLIDTNNIRLPRAGMEMNTFMKECMSESTGNTLCLLC